MIKAMIFDLDGVLLINVPEMNLKSATGAMKEQGIELNGEDKNMIVPRHPEDFSKILQKKYDFDRNKFVKRHIEIFMSLYKDISLADGAKELLQNLKDNNMKIALATSSPRDVVDIFLDIYKLNDVFDKITTFDDCKERKPNPEVYLTSLKKLNLDAKECVVVEDTSAGIEAAKKAGIKAIAVPNKWTMHEDFSKSDRIIKSLREINLGLLDKLGE